MTVVVVSPAGPTAADTEVTGAPVVPDSLEFVLAVVLPLTCPAFGEFDMENRMVYIESEIAGLDPVDFESGLKVNNMPVIGSHSVVEVVA